MSKVKGAGFGVRFYRKPGPARQMSDKKTTKGKDTPPQEIAAPFPRREAQPVIDVPDQLMKLELFESWPPENAATKLAREIQKAKQALQKPYALELMPEEPVAARPAPQAAPQPQAQFTGYKKPPALQVALDKVKAKADAKKKEEEAKEKRRAEDITKEVKLWAAAQVGDCHAIRLLVLEGADLDKRDSYGRTAVNIAMQYNQKDAIKTLMAAKEMRKMAKDGALPNMNFFRKLSHEKTGT